MQFAGRNALSQRGSLLVRMMRRSALPSLLPSEPSAASTPLRPLATAIPTHFTTLHSTPYNTAAMNTIAARRVAFAATRAPVRSSLVSRRFASGVTSGGESTQSAEDRQADKTMLQKGAKRDPELYVCLPKSCSEQGEGQHSLLCVRMELTSTDPPSNHVRRLRPRGLALQLQPDLVFLREQDRQSRRHRALEDWRRCPVPVPPARRPEQAQEGCAECVE